ncbi:condensation domain-containing protein [Jatrophihabitans sp.]|uniref:condensation domain-containing protein n=1 Tax=Jatrophihabitans sp. TaxID=1932789 RepID=UPI002B6F33CE|nr:condensation domain-containing protein [Jatrophihabitans sp.]
MASSEILGESTARYPLSYRQRDPTGLARSPHNVIPLVLRIKGELSLQSLEGALEDVVERQEALRTRMHYSETDGNLGYQEVLPPLPVPITVHDVAVPSAAARDEFAVDLLTRMNEESMPFSVQPSLRAALYRFDDSDAVLTLHMHHLFSDGWSTDVLRREIAACYQARVTGIPHALPTPVPYREFAAWEQEFLQSEKAAIARHYWQDKLAGAQLFTMPADRPHGPDTRAPRTAMGTFSIDPAGFARVAESAAQSRCSVWHVFLAAYMVLANKVTGATDITLFTSNSGRLSPEFYDTIGFFVNPVPLRLEFGNCETFRDLMLVARKTSLDARKHQLPFVAIAEVAPALMGGAADPGSADPLAADPQALMPVFNYINSPVAQDDTEFATSVESVVTPEELPNSLVRGGLIWTFVVVPSGEFRCGIEYEPDALDASTVEGWGSDFIDLILAMTDRPDQEWQKR